jgi:hypothetical protein
MIPIYFYIYSMTKTFKPEIGKRKEKRGKRIRETMDENK